MITSGLVITLGTDAALAAQAIAQIGARAEFTPGQRNDRWLPVAMEARDDAASRDLHDWLQALPGVEFVDVVSVNFEEPDLIVGDSGQPSMQGIIGGLPGPAGIIPALPASSFND
ncbi:MAG: hypothetical protein K9N62_09520 [Verrucomicrobia bacterium]|nr:hypothetical protein [Verrucomicrobiota bacterium]